MNRPTRPMRIRERTATREPKRFPTLLFSAIIWNSIGVHRARQPPRAGEFSHMVSGALAFSLVTRDGRSLRRTPTCLHRFVHDSLRQIGVLLGHMRQGQLARIFDGEAVAFPPGDSLRNFYKHAPDVTNLARHTGKDQIQLAAESRHSFFVKAFDEKLS